MASPTDILTAGLTFPSGLPRVVHDCRIEDDIMYVRDLAGVERIVWSDQRLSVYSRYDSHSYSHEWREKEYVGDPRPPRVRDYLDYQASVAEAMESALACQNRIEREVGEEVPIFLTER